MSKDPITMTEKDLTCPDCKGTVFGYKTIPRYSSKAHKALRSLCVACNPDEELYVRDYSMPTELVHVDNA